MNRSTGFTLAEIAIALLIVGLLLGSALVPLSAQIDVRNFAETQRTQEQVREAIIGFALANGRLPCPAAGNVVAGTAGAGTEQFTAPSCTVLMGVIPWATLGVPETDAWGRRFSYRVSPAFADSVENPPGTPLATWNSRATAYTPPAPPPTYLPQSVSSPVSPANQAPLCNLATPPSLSSFALCSLGDIAVYTRNEATHAPVPVGSALPAVIISHGKNGYGAWQQNGTPVTPAPVAGSDEAANINGNTTAIPTGGYSSWAFYSRPPTPAAAGCSDTAAGAFCEFDDIVVMISSSMLMARMVAAGRLP